MKIILIISFLILFDLIYGDELIAGHVLFRHGDRTPITTYPTDPMKEQDWPNGFGQLTTTGIDQHYHLGQFFRTRYQSLLSSAFDPKEIFVRSTDYDRTLMSAQANLAGLYPVLNNSTFNQTPIHPIPIHTEPIKDDFLLAVNDCPRYVQIEDNVYQSDEFKNMNAYYAPFFEKLQLWTNISNITLYNAWDIADTIFVENKHNKTPAWADAGVQKNLTDISDLSFHFLYLNNDTKRIRGGPIIQDIWQNMNDTIHGETHHKFRMYSAHDTTVSAALAFLGINWPHQPPYACALFIDLYKQNSSYFITVSYINVTDSNDPHEYVLNGCSSNKCPFDVFTSIYEPRFPASSEVECSKDTPPSPPSDGNNKKLIATIVIIGTILGVISVVLFIWLYKRRGENEPALLSTDAYQTIA